MVFLTLNLMLSLLKSSVLMVIPVLKLEPHLYQLRSESKAANHDSLVEKGARRVWEIKSLIEKRFNFNDEDNKVELTIRPPEYDKSLCAAFNVEDFKFKLLTGTPVRMGVNNIMGRIMRRGAVGCQIIVAGKVRGQRAKAQKYSAGYLISTGQPNRDFVDIGMRHVHMRQGVLGIKVKIMMNLERNVGKIIKVMPDFVKIHEPKEENLAEIVPNVLFNRRGEE